MMRPSSKPLELSFPLPKAPHTILHAHLTFLTTSTTLFLTTTVAGESGPTLAPMGSFVYAMPDRMHASNVISTTIYSSDSSIDYAGRVAKILARKTALPVYVGCSMNFSGLTVEEEMEGLTKVIETVITKWQERV